MTQHDDSRGNDSVDGGTNIGPTADGEILPLSSRDLESFINDGYVLLKRAFDPAVAAACRDEIWRVMEEETRTRKGRTTSENNDATSTTNITPTLSSSTPSSLAPPAAAAAPKPPTPSCTVISRDDPSTWPTKFPITRIYRSEDGSPWSNVFTARLHKAVDQLCGGPGSWESFGCGWWMITFPRGSSGEEGTNEGEREDYSSPSSCSIQSSSAPPSPSSSFYPPHPWRLDGHWHIDGQYRHRCIHTQQVGLVPIFLFSDIRRGGGGTALCQGSHKYIARLLREAGPQGMDALEVIRKGQAWVKERTEEGKEAVERCRVVETVGEAGDVMFTHPFLLHGRSANCAKVSREGGREGGREQGVRFMCHPSVSLTRVPRVGGREEENKQGMSVVERAIVAGWEGKEDGREMFLHDECLAATEGWEERKRRRQAQGRKQKRRLKEGGGEGNNDEEALEALPVGVDANVMSVMGMTGFGRGGRKKRLQS